MKSKTMMKRGLISLLLGIFLMSAASAVWVNSGESLYIRKDEVVGEDIIFAGDTLNIDGTVKADVIFAGKEVNIRGVVEGSLIAAGNELTLTGEVKNDVIFAGEKVNIAGTIGDNVIFAGKQIQTKEEAKIGGDIITFSQSQELKGSAGGKKIKVKISPELKSGVGKLQGAGGNVFAFLGFLFKIFAFLFILVTAILMFLVIPKQTEKSSSLIRKEPLKSFLTGILLLIGIPLVVLLLMVLIITIPFAIILGLIYLLALLVISKIVVAHALGGKILEYFKSKGGGFWHNLLALIIGLLILEILLLIPFLGWITKLLIILFGLGAIGLAIYDSRKTKKKEPEKKEVLKKTAKKKPALKKRKKVAKKKVVKKSRERK